MRFNTPFRLFAILLVMCSQAFGQFKPGSIGVVYLMAEGQKSYSLTVVIPSQMLSEPLTDMGSSIDFLGSIQFFDDKGTLYSIQGPFNFKIHQWCENDGGIQSRPTLEVVVDKTKLKRKLSKRKEIQNIACFVAVNTSTIQSMATNMDPSKDIVMSGDYNGDGKMDCFISTYYDDAENCAGQPVNHLGINLLVAGVSYALRCCGP